MRVVVLSDTHMRRAWPKRVLPPQVLDAVAGADAVLHAGDVVEGHVLAGLEAAGPVHAVLGNNDTTLRDVLPEELELDLAGVRVAMVHDSGPRAGRAGRLRRRFPNASVVVFGHSHDPVCETTADGVLLFNPGSPTERRRQPFPTYGVLDLDDGAVLGAEIVPLPIR